MRIEHPEGPELHAVHVVSGLFLGGGQLGAVELVEGLVASGTIDTRLCFLGSPTRRLAHNSFSSIDEYDGHYGNPLTLWRTVLSLRRDLKNRLPDIVHTHGWDADLVTALAIRGLGIKHVSHIRTLSTWARDAGFRRRLRLVLTRWALRQSKSVFIAVSEAARGSASKHIGISLGSIRTIPNGVDLEPFIRNRRAYVSDYHQRRPSVVLGAAGRLAPEKGVDILIQSIALLGLKDADIKVRIAGEGRMRAMLGELAQRLGVSSQVEFVGMVADMSMFYRELDIFVLPSLAEGMPRSVIEAMASGLPVIATKVGGVPELIEDGVDGVLVDAMDPNALAEQIARLLKDVTMRRQLGLKAAKRARTAFGIDRVTKSVEELYMELTRY